jgi:hypothetical protein
MSSFIDFDELREHERKTIHNHNPMCVFYSFHDQYTDIAYLLDQDREVFFNRQVDAWHKQGVVMRAMEDATDGINFNGDNPTDEYGRWGLVLALQGHTTPCPLALSKGVAISGLTYWFKDKEDRDRCLKESQAISKFCAVCGNPSKKKCFGCGKVRYCGKDCQKKHWKTHKKVCKK